MASSRSKPQTTVALANYQHIYDGSCRGHKLTQRLEGIVVLVHAHRYGISSTEMAGYLNVGKMKANDCRSVHRMLR